jgi:hypothetical protein
VNVDAAALREVMDECKLDEMSSIFVAFVLRDGKRDPDHTDGVLTDICEVWVQKLSPSPRNVAQTTNFEQKLYVTRKTG